MNKRAFFGLFASLALGACVHTARQPDSLQICDSSGCHEKPIDQITQEKTEDSNSEINDSRILVLQRLATKDPRAAYDLGLRYFRGDGVRQDSYRALQWMRDAAERGDRNAQSAIGRLYLTGLEEMGSDPREAEKWLRIAADRGDKEASKLLVEAARLRAMDDAYYRWLTRWQPIFYSYWYSGYPYYWYWRYPRWRLSY